MRASSARRASVSASAATSRAAIAAQRSSNGGQGRLTSTWLRTKRAQAAPIWEASAASGWLAQAAWYEHCLPGAQSPQRSMARRILPHFAALVVVVAARSRLEDAGASR
jgi:hypothetical protein